MKYSAIWPVFCLLLASIFINACTDPTAIGADLLEGDRTRLEFFDTISIAAFVEEAPASATHSRFNAFDAYLLGDMEDPIFGRSKAELFFQVLPRFADPLIGEDLIIDSVILNLPLAASAYYGNTDQNFELAVRRIDAVIANDNEYDSDTTFASIEEPLATVLYAPTADSVTYLSYISSTTGTSVKLPTIRIPLSNDIGTEILSIDSLTRNSDDQFVEAFNGIHLQPTSLNQGMPALNLINSETGIFVYYHSDTLARQYHLEVASASVKFMSLEHDFTGTPVEAALTNNDNISDSLLFTQGMVGPIIRIAFPHIAELRNRNLVVNKAELELWEGDLAGSQSFIFEPGEQLLLATKDENGNFVPIDDYTISLANLPDRFGGNLINEGGLLPNAYRMNIGTHLQEMIDGRESNEFYLILASKVNRASRTILYGPNHPEFPIKLSVTGTIVTN